MIILQESKYLEYIGKNIYYIVKDKRVKNPWKCKVIGIWISEDPKYSEIHLVRYIENKIDRSFSLSFKEFDDRVRINLQDAEELMNNR